MSWTCPGLVHRPGERARDERLELGRQRLRNVLLEAAQHEQLQQLVRVLQRGALELGLADVEGLIEGLGRREDLAVEQVEQRPQLGQVVLQRRAGEQQSLVVEPWNLAILRAR